MSSVEVDSHAVCHDILDKNARVLATCASVGARAADSASVDIDKGGGSPPELSWLGTEVKSFTRTYAEASAQNFDLRTLVVEPWHDRHDCARFIAIGPYANDGCID